MGKPLKKTVQDAKKDELETCGKDKINLFYGVR